MSVFNLITTSLNATELSPSRVNDIVSLLGLEPGHPLKLFAESLPVESVKYLKWVRKMADTVIYLELTLREFGAQEKVWRLLIDITGERSLSLQPT